MKKKKKKILTENEIQMQAQRAHLEHMFRSLCYSNAAGIHDNDERLKKKRRRRDWKNEVKKCRDEFPGISFL
jgi:hypothetical protein